MKISKQAFITAWKKQKLVKGALRSAHVRKDYTNYEDFLQEGILVYAQMLTALTGLSPKEVDRRSFRKIIWHTIDLLRKDQRYSEHQIGLEQAATVGQSQNWNNKLVLEKEIAKMTKLEQVIFFNNLILQEPISALAPKANVSRGQLQRVKHQLLERLQSVLEK